MIEFHNLCKRFHAITALGDVSFRIETGTAHALVGENGAGKSTLMKILGGAYVPDEEKSASMARQYGSTPLRIPSPPAWASSIRNST